VSEGSAEGGGAPLSDGQFGDTTETGDLPPYTAQNPGTGLFPFGFYAWGTSQNPRRRKKRKKSR
jgi:hypothetical protein